MSLLLDTNVISELQRTRRHPDFQRWWEQQELPDLWISVLTLGEVQRGIEDLRARDAAHSTALQSWFDRIVSLFHDRILPVTADIAVIWGRMSGDRTRPPIDTLLAATAGAHDLTLVTRNTRDFAGLGISLLDPFERR